MSLEQFPAVFSRLRESIGRVIAGQHDVIDGALLAAFASGHLLLEGPPGLGKTLLARTLARVLALETARIQFTPDLMPSDITGNNIFQPQVGDFRFVSGPIFTQLLLADEINRAPAKTQSALLEAMQERQVTTDGVSRPLPAPFLVIATQNPVESQGTYPLPEAQLDRFLLKVFVSPPGPATEVQILRRHADGHSLHGLQPDAVEPVLAAGELRSWQQVLRQVRVADSVLQYITELLQRTRQHPALEWGASPRGGLAMLSTAQVHAAQAGRNFVTPDDVKAVALAALRHRLLLRPDAELLGTRTDDCIAEILRVVPVPHAEG